MCDRFYGGGHFFTPIREQPRKDPSSIWLTEKIFVSEFEVVLFVRFC